ncbi:MAG: histone deacetylase, partial [bacterium]|nr:histone deacetylase [bacterium]
MTEKRKTAYLYDDVYLNHDTGTNHPEKPGRLTSINNKIKRSDIYSDLYLLDPTDALLEYIYLVHGEEYVDTVRRECDAGLSSLSTGDTVICRDSFDVALKAVGGILSAVDSVFDGSAKNAFCAARPPGHHATPNRGMGFCIFNNIAIAARYAQKKYGIERVMIADWDVHHGNGTQDTFYSDGSVFFFSTHQSPMYPGTGSYNETGTGEGTGTIMNRPFPEGAGDDEVIGAFKDDLLPAAKEFKPDFTLISAGFDSRTEDPLGGFEVTDNGFRELTRIMLEIANING